MDWASNIFIALLLTDITGTIFFLVGELFKKLFGKDIRFLRFLTKVTLYAYLVPFVYIMLYLDRRLQAVQLESSINLFYSTPAILFMNAVLGCIWVGLFLALLAYRLYRRYCWIEICRGNIPEEDEKIFKMFTDICTELGIEGRISMCRNDSVHMPCITYYHGFIIILPLLRYTEEEARVILYHELCHYLNGDLYLKTISVIVTLLHVFNPAVHRLMDDMDLICEKYCDRVACEKGLNAFTADGYFRAILKLLLDGGKKDKYQLFALADSRSNYERRVEYMLGYHIHGGLKKGTALVLSVCFLLGNSVTALAAGDGVALAYKELADRTSVKEVETADTVDTENSAYFAGSPEEDVLEELARLYDLDPDKVVLMDEGNAEPYALIRQIKWTIDPDYTYVSTGFNQDEGDSVSIVCVGDADDIDYQMGIKDPDCIMRYVEGSGKIYHDFEIKIAGRHYFFVSNLSETETLHIEAVIVR